MDKLTQRLSALLNPETGGPWIRRMGLLLSILAVLLLAATAADATWRLLLPGGAQPVDTSPLRTPPPPHTGEAQGRNQSSLADVASHHLFGTPPTEEEGEAASRTAREVPLEAPETRLNISLTGILARGGSGRGIAIIERDGGQKVHAVGAELPGNATLEHVYGDRVILSRDGDFEMLKLQRDRLELAGAGTSSANTPPPSVQRTSSRQARESRPSPPRVSRAELEELRDSDPDHLASLVQLRPVLSGGTLRGFRISPRGDGARYFEQAGLMDGDIVTEINRVPVNDMERLESMVRDLESAREVRFRVERDGQEQELQLRID